MDLPNDFKVADWKVSLVKDFFSKDGSNHSPEDEVLKNGKHDEVSGCLNDEAVVNKIDEINDKFDDMSTEGNNEAKDVELVSDEHLQDKAQVSDEEIPSLTMFRPKLELNKKLFPIRDFDEVVKSDQGRSCVFLVLKTRASGKETSFSKIERQRSILKRSKEVRALAAKYEIKYQEEYWTEVRATFNFCFKLPSKARKFYVEVNDKAKAREGPQSMTIFLCSEEELGYQHPPVLHENDLLLIHSPEKFGNVFKTSIFPHLKEDSDGNVSLRCKKVVQLNAFIFDRCCNSKAKSMGELKRHKSRLFLSSDENGDYILVSKDDPSKFNAFSSKFGFIVHAESPGITKLKFKRKIDMFKFLFAQEDTNIETLQIEPSLIRGDQPDVSQEIASTTVCDDLIEENNEKENGEKGFVTLLDVDEGLESKDSGLNDSIVTARSIYEIELEEKDAEINRWKFEVSQRDLLLQRQSVEIQQKDQLLEEKDKLLLEKDEEKNRTDVAYEREKSKNLKLESKHHAKDEVFFKMQELLGDEYRKKQVHQTFKEIKRDVNQNLNLL